MVTVLVPSALRQYTGERAELRLSVESSLALAELLDRIGQEFPAFNRKVRDETGALRRFVNIYLGGEESRRLNGLDTLVEPGAEVLIIQSVAGG
ncbi:molybdopterin converting factor small subunit [Psychromicrobium silvestre]|uniref:Molybdopterin converting factor small subunit n=1 Tax=Psychromicrobium silvestre TaxID=1645614 RepID=A0A7Y9S7D4_9MICC|nr:MoaD/ThiS family protein [Psychromicrobium silvestre]NYE96003.1 molybdopterin converting factor small subunit [Psychromicrobium silvestre]